MSCRKVAMVLVLVLALAFPTFAFAQDDLTVQVDYVETCGDVALEMNIQGGDAPFSIIVNFGDDENVEISDVYSLPYTLHHMYPTQEEYEYSVKVYDLNGLEGEAEGIVTVSGPEVVLESNPSPPLLPLGSEGARIDFTALVSGGQEPFALEWDLNDDGVSDEGLDPASNIASFTYTEEGKFEANVKVTDACGFSEQDQLTIVIVDPTSDGEPEVEERSGEGEEQGDEGEADSQEGCQPMAQRISDALNILSPSQLEGQYSCEDIFNFFQGEDGGLHHSFGLLWRAYQMTQIIDELTWEDIVDWHLEGSGWGVLQQLDRFSEALDDVSIVELYDRIMSGENTIGEIRSAVKAAIRFEADFEDALERLEDGTSPGALNQLYRTALEMEIEPGVLDEYLETGISLSQIKHASKLADQTGSEWQILLGAYTQGYGWGEIRKAFHLADETTDFETILAIGTNAYREQQRDLERAEREEEKDEQTAKRLAEQYGIGESDILEFLHSACGGDWTCVREQLREQAKAERNLDHDDGTAARIAEKYGVPEGEVRNIYIRTCRGDWSCVREYFRDQSQKDHGKSTK
jgi:hypothetical protein